jgi:hypothetical protein
VKLTGLKQNCFKTQLISITTQVRSQFITDGEPEAPGSVKEPSQANFRQTALT